MIKKNNKTEELDEKLASEGKISYLNEPHHIEAIMKMNDAMDEVKRDFIIKSFNSEKDAENCIINT